MELAIKRALAGIVAAGVVLGVGALVAVPIGSNSSPFYAVGSGVVDNTPLGVREWAITTFDTSDKTALFVGMSIVIALLAAGAGIIERKDRPWGSAIFGVLGVIGVVAALTRAGATFTFAIPTVVGVVLGIVVLRAMTTRSELAATPTDAAQGIPRRGFFGLAAASTVLALAAGVAGKVMSQSRNITANRIAFKVPVPTSPAPPIPAAAALQVSGLSTYVTTNDDFYRIDTALTVPQVSSDTWSLRIHGMVDNEKTITFADLANRDSIERTVTLTCVSNEIGDDLIGNATWIGYPLKAILDEVGIQSGADMLLSSGHDDFTAGTPIEVVMDGRDAMLAVGMNGQPLPVEHGYPARLVVPGLYGYVSATKWVTDIEVTSFAKATAYWTDRGWSPKGPIKTASRIDTPAFGANVGTGKVMVAGVAWAQHTGISMVEVQMDQGNWHAATLSAEYSKDTWRQWTYEWDATPGQHEIRARATDATGKIQTSIEQGTVPDGATGYPKIMVTVA